MTTLQDCFDFALRIEQNGETFYRLAAVQAQDPEARVLFGYLADEEAGHYLTFRGLKADAGKAAASERPEFSAFLRPHLDRVVFGNPDLPAEAAGLSGTLSIIDFALQREADAVLFYQELKSFVSPALHAALDGILAQEHEHILKLRRLRGKFPS
jgi:rubrerythrin